MATPSISCRLSRIQTCVSSLYQTVTLLGGLTQRTSQIHASKGRLCIAIVNVVGTVGRLICAGKARSKRGRDKDSTGKGISSPNI